MQLLYFLTTVTSQVHSARLTSACGVQCSTERLVDNCNSTALSVMILMVFQKKDFMNFAESNGIAPTS